MNKFKYYIRILVLSFLLLPTFVFASDDNEYIVVSENMKYYKTVTYNSNNSLYSLLPTNSSETFEITEEEFNAAKPNSTMTLSSYSGTVETTYKRMTTTISSNGSYYRYKVVLSWKNMPKVRSYDIIGIGFLGSVKVHSDLNFKQEYCINSGGCSTSTTNYPQIFNYGAGTTFKLPTGDLSSLKQTLYFDVEKNTSSTIILQDAYGDYSHATSSISLTNAKKYTVVSNVGINLNSSVLSYYDSIDVAKASWDAAW